MAEPNIQETVNSKVFFFRTKLNALLKLFWKARFDVLYKMSKLNAKQIPSQVFSSEKG